MMIYTSKGRIRLGAGLALLLALGTLACSAQRNRPQWQKPAEIMAAMGVAEGKVVADMGAGEGWFTTRLADAVGATGRVYAVDVSESAMQDLKDAVEDYDNVTTVLSDPDDPMLPTGQLDAILICNAYHEMDDYAVILQHLKRALKPTGVLVIVDNIMERRRESSRDRQTRSHELGIDFARADLEAAGFDILRAEDPFLTKPNDEHQWILVGRPRQ